MVLAQGEEPNGQGDGCQGVPGEPLSQAGSGRVRRQEIETHRNAPLGLRADGDEGPEEIVPGPDEIRDRWLRQTAARGQRHCDVPDQGETAGSVKARRALTRPRGAPSAWCVAEWKAPGMGPLHREEAGSMAPTAGRYPQISAIPCYSPSLTQETNALVGDANSSMDVK